MNTPIRPDYTLPPRLDHSRRRLEKAIFRLEAALSDAGHGDGESTVENDLSRQLAAARAENAELRRRNEVVSQRLDAAIGRLQSILEE